MAVGLKLAAFIAGPWFLTGTSYFFFSRFYLFIHERQREREAETQAEGEAGSMQGAWRGTRSRVSRIRPWAEGGAKPLSHPGCPSTGTSVFTVRASYLGHLVKTQIPGPTCRGSEIIVLGGAQVCGLYGAPEMVCKILARSIEKVQSPHHIHDSKRLRTTGLVCRFLWNWNWRTLSEGTSGWQSKAQCPGPSLHAGLGACHQTMAHSLAAYFCE